ncbi:hypothetical protein [Novosphingobium rosa]|uniref:hypothetical protein n=1 Tax=Novosphingobium rosa TaxID=76978 RepID=UPI000A725DDF|nr:hypothetical protein [Novosphingobium rosa]
MMSATPSPSWDELAAQLAALAGQMAQDRQVVDEADDPARWRDASTLWPGFGTVKG